VRHGQRCTQERCAAGCGFVAIDEWLDTPVTKSEQAADDRRTQRLQALMRGEIPA
jgi:hypothetical protein